MDWLSRSKRLRLLFRLLTRSNGLEVRRLAARNVSGAFSRRRLRLEVIRRAGLQTLDLHLVIGAPVAGSGLVQVVRVGAVLHGGRRLLVRLPRDNGRVLV